VLPPFFEVENLTKRFGGLTAVNGVSFQVSRDEIVGLIGPNGAGKTTVLRLITSILKPDSGRVRFKGKDITRAKPWAHHCQCYGSLPQSQGNEEGGMG